MLTGVLSLFTPVYVTSQFTVTGAQSLSGVMLFALDNIVHVCPNIPIDNNPINNVSINFLILLYF